MPLLTPTVLEKLKELIPLHVVQSMFHDEASDERLRELGRVMKSSDLYDVLAVCVEQFDVMLPKPYEHIVWNYRIEMVTFDVLMGGYVREMLVQKFLEVMAKEGAVPMNTSTLTKIEKRPIQSMNEAQSTGATKRKCTGHDRKLRGRETKQTPPQKLKK